jgi:hypothetical protein
MPNIKIVQNSFTQGEVGEYFDAREDLAIYPAAAKTVENWFILPQGGLLRRTGFEWIDGTNPTTLSPAKADTTMDDETGFESHARLIAFRFSTAQEYVLVFEAGKFHVYKDGGYATTVTSNCFWDASNINELRFAQTFDTMIVVQEDNAPVQITRTGHTSWTCTPISHTFLPMANFNNGITLTPNDKTGTTTFTASADASSDFSTNDYIRINGGLAKVTSVSGTTINVTIEEDLASTTAATSTEYEQTAFFSGNYPRSVSFHQNRLIYGGTRLKPQTIFGSQSGDFFNFKPTVATTEGSTTTGSVTDDSGFAFTIGSDEVNVIRHLVSKQTLFIFTSGGEFEMTGAPVTPTNVNIRLQTRYGALAGGLRPTTIDNEVLFCSANGRELRGFVFDFNSDSYYAKNYSIVAHDIMDNPQDMTFMRAHRNTNQNYLFVVMQDGTLGVFGLNVEKQVQGWSRFTIDGGKFKKVLAVNDADTTPETQRLYALVERTYTKDDATTVTSHTLERLTEEQIYLDGWARKQNSTAFNTLAGAYNFANQTVNCVADGVVHANVAIGTRASTAGTTLNDNYTDVVVGKNYTSTMTTLTLPVTINGQPYRGEQITKVSALINLNKTQALNVDGTAIDFRTTGQALDTAIAQFTGTKKTFLSGISTDPNVSITVDLPLACTLLGVTTEVKFGQ